MRTQQKIFRWLLSLRELIIPTLGVAILASILVSFKSRSSEISAEVVVAEVQSSVYEGGGLRQVPAPPSVADILVAESADAGEERSLDLLTQAALESSIALVSSVATSASPDEGEDGSDATSESQGQADWIDESEMISRLAMVEADLVRDEMAKQDEARRLAKDALVKSNPKKRVRVIEEAPVEVVQGPDSGSSIASRVNRISPRRLARVYYPAEAMVSEEKGGQGPVARVYPVEIDAEPTVEDWAGGEDLVSWEVLVHSMRESVATGRSTSALDFLAVIHRKSLSAQADISDMKAGDFHTFVQQLGGLASLQDDSLAVELASSIPSANPEKSSELRMLMARTALNADRVAEAVAYLGDIDVRSGVSSDLARFAKTAVDGYFSQVQ